MCTQKMICMGTLKQNSPQNRRSASIIRDFCPVFTVFVKGAWQTRLSFIPHMACAALLMLMVYVQHFKHQKGSAGLHGWICSFSCFAHTNLTIMFKKICPPKNSKFESPWTTPLAAANHPQYHLGPGMGHMQIRVFSRIIEIACIHTYRYAQIP